jgi:hypothetical protein
MKSERVAGMPMSVTRKGKGSMGMSRAKSRVQGASHAEGDEAMSAKKHSKKSKAVHAHGKVHGRRKQAGRHAVASAAGGVMPSDATVPLTPPAENSSGEGPAASSSSALELVSAVSPEPSAVPTVEDGGPAAESPMAASSDSSSKLPESDGSPDTATPSWDGMLRSTGLGSDGMRVGWIVAFALFLTLALAICTRESEATTLAGVPVASADAGYGSEVRG